MDKRIIAAAGVFQFFCLLAGGVVSLALSAAGYQPGPSGGTTIYSVVVFIMITFIVVIEIGSMLKIHDSTIHTVYTSASLLLCYLFSSDMQRIINPSSSAQFATAAESVNFIAFHLIVLSHTYLINFLYDSDINKYNGGAITAYSVADIVIYFILKTKSLQFIAYIVYVPVLVYIAYKISRAVITKKNYNLTFFFTISILVAAVGSQCSSFLYSAGICQFHVYGIETTYTLIIILLYICVYVTFILGTEHQALKASEYKLQAEVMKTRLLREQINPHFIFNSLLTVKDAYHTNLERGDTAMNYFSQYLRANVEAMNMDCIPFGDELDNVENYINLENMKRKKPINIIYDVEYDSFNLPVMSLQVFVENAVKYARTEDKDDGYIAISSKRSKDGIHVEVTDNGKGFDVNNIKDSSCGIRNAKERFKLLLNADVTVESEPGKGTSVKIIIPHGAYSLLAKKPQKN